MKAYDWIEEFHQKELIDRPKWCLEHRGKICLANCIEETCPLNPYYVKKETIDPKDIH